MGYLPVCYSNCDFKLPELNWQCSVSVDVFNFEDKTPYKVFWQMEPEEIIPVEAKLIKNHKFYDLILTWNQEVLSQCANARLFPPGAVWYQDSDTSQKKFAVSYLTSSKTGCYGYDFRQGVYRSLPEIMQCYSHGNPSAPVPITKHKSPPYLPNKGSMLVPFQYSIIMENAKRTNYFTEKLNDCLATKTIPIYWGAPNVKDFYNTDGILSFDGQQDLMDILQGLTPEFYQSKQAVIEENYQKALKYYDRTGNVVRAIIDSWTPKIEVIHSGEPNVG